MTMHDQQNEPVPHETVQRVSEIEETTNRVFFLPLAYGLVPHLAKWNITPNMVSLTGLGLGDLAQLRVGPCPRTASDGFPRA